MLMDMLRRRSSGALVAVIATVLTLAACQSQPFPPSGAHDPEVMAAREAAVAEERELLSELAMQQPLTEAATDYCDAGQNNFKIRDPYFWTCGHSTIWVVPDAQTDPALLISAYRSHLETVGCEPDAADFGMASDYWATMGVAGENAHGEPYTVDSLPSASAICEDGRRIGIRFGTAAGVESDETLFAFAGSEIIEQTPFDRAAIAASTTPLVVTLTVGTNYHYISRTKDIEESDPSTPPVCVCHSGGSCDCPGG